ncbi:unnamed protein product [marine sediment metagenome]|uniref:Uncharacterized protein n=1 Tax=marine sediment metagenome TaxID=412755 RepID=X1NYY3_9ZZZZ
MLRPAHGEERTTGTGPSGLVAVDVDVKDGALGMESWGDILQEHGNRGWRTRYVNAYTTRLFSAISVTDQRFHTPRLDSPSL